MLAVLAGLCLATGCSGGSGNATQPIVPGGPTPTAVPTGSVSLQPSTLAFITTGSGAAQTSTASETGYDGTFTVTATTCDGIASVSPTSTSVFTVTPDSNGTCTITISGAPGESATLSVSVTLSGGSLQMRGRSAGQ
jgi:hypothetical protein